MTRMDMVGMAPRETMRSPGPRVGHRRGAGRLPLARLVGRRGTRDATVDRRRLREPAPRPRGHHARRGPARRARPVDGRPGRSGRGAGPVRLARGPGRFYRARRPRVRRSPGRTRPGDRTGRRPFARLVPRGDRVDRRQAPARRPPGRTGDRHPSLSTGRPLARTAGRFPLSGASSSRSTAPGRWRPISSPTPGHSPTRPGPRARPCSNPSSPACR